jgi:hypothetical protein
MDDKCFAVSQSSIWNTIGLVEGDFALDWLRFGMVRLEVDCKCERDQPESLPNDVCAVTWTNVVWIVD